MPVEVVIRVLIADDHRLVRCSLRRVLERAPDIAVVGEAGSSDEAVRIACELHPDVVLVDLIMPGGGLTAIERLSRTVKTVQTIAVSGAVDPETIQAALDAGASDFVSKGLGCENLLDAIRSVARGQKNLHPPGSHKKLTPAGPEQGRTPADASQSKMQAALTRRERQVLAGIATGQTNRDIAQDLAISPKTVEAHRTRISKKLGLRRRVQLLHYAIASGLAAPRELTSSPP